MILTAARDWRLLTACQPADPDLSFPVSESGRPLEQAARAKAVCAGCQVQRECLAFALATETGPRHLGRHERAGMPDDRQDSVYENMIPALATATGIACLQLTSQHITTIENALEQGTRLPRSPGWEHKATVHAEVFSLLAEAVDYPAVAGVLSLGAGIVRDLAITSGPAADGIIINSHRRLLARLRARDANAAEHEMEELLKCLHTMWHLTERPRTRAAKALATDASPPPPWGRAPVIQPACLGDQIPIPTEEL